MCLHACMCNKRCHKNKYHAINIVLSRSFAPSCRCNICTLALFEGSCPSLVVGRTFPRQFAFPFCFFCSSLFLCFAGSLLGGGFRLRLRLCLWSALCLGLCGCFCLSFSPSRAGSFGRLFLLAFFFPSSCSSDSLSSSSFALLLSPVRFFLAGGSMHFASKSSFTPSGASEASG